MKSPALENEIKAFCVRNELTPRESEVVALLVQGIVKIKDVAQKLKLSPNTINNHVNSIFMKTRASSKSQLLAGFINAVAGELDSIRWWKRVPRVLLIDRDEGARGALKMFLESRGMSVRACESDDGCEKQVIAFDPQFILLDAATMNGELADFVCRVVQKIDRKTTQVIVIGELSDANLGRCQVMHLGGLDAFPKPLDHAKLMRLMTLQYIENDEDRDLFLELEAAPRKMMGGQVPVTRDNFGTGGLYVTFGRDWLGTNLDAAHPSQLREGDRVDLEVRLQPTDEVIPLRTLVAWTRDDHERLAVGFRFVKMQDHHREHLRTLLPHDLRPAPWIPSGMTEV